MKKYLDFIFGLIVTGLFFSACNNDAIDDLQGVYGDMLICHSNEATVQPTTKLGKGIKSLNVDIKDAQGNDVTVNFGSSEWILPSATYKISNTVANKTCVVKVNGEAMQSGDIDVSLIEGKYYFNGLFANAAGQRVKLNYVGELAFVVGQDDPEASGYTLTIAPTQIVDWSTGAPVVVNPNATKYIISINNPAGQPAAYLEAVNANQLGHTDLAGEYTIQDKASEPWLMGNGFAIPQYGVKFGSYFVDEAGVEQYITAGKIIISTAKDAEGQDLFSFEGADLETLSGVDGSAGKGSFKIKFAAIAK